MCRGTFKHNQGPHFLNYHQSTPIATAPESNTKDDAANRSDDRPDDKLKPPILQGQSRSRKITNQSIFAVFPGVKMPIVFRWQSPPRPPQYAHHASNDRQKQRQEYNRVNPLGNRLSGFGRRPLAVHRPVACRPVARLSSSIKRADAWVLQNWATAGATASHFRRQPIEFATTFVLAGCLVKWALLFDKNTLKRGGVVWRS